MGCDIHIAIERQDETGKWREVPYAVEPWNPRDDDGWNQRQWAEFDALVAKGIVAVPRTFRNRNYSLFGILADVRNGYGFAGVDTGDSWKPIAPERGLPFDCTITNVDRESDDDAGIHWLGDHSHTWIGLDELKAFDWDGTGHQARGLVELPVYRAWKAGTNVNPPEWCSGASGPNMDFITEEQAATWVAGTGRTVKVKAEWHRSARVATYDWAGDVLPLLDRIADGRPLRLIVGFDS